MRFCTDVETSIGIGGGNLYRQHKGWLSVSLRTRVIITRRRFIKYRMLGTKPTE
ncbi:hypothetical protein Goshw_021269 [Gossypium schwendimanii]|uniref:Uncharacterized protein n=1 Tax=Gossypium schwendimanii TaxID=34291 RepID=A0A7J9N8M5_GOSSC|nr:hypothetical protein [Gossypium schwendimanii]